MRLGRVCVCVILIAIAVVMVVSSAGARDNQQQAARTVWDGVYSEAQAGRGKSTYRTECASCHLENLGGADMGPALVGDTFLATWSDLSVGDLYERVRISMPQDKPASLSRERYADIVAYMLQVNKFPTGTSELGHDLPTLKAIKITKAPSVR
jgi:quinoprotein glucose dehydrogenase